ncbi:MAG: hypothetical protein QM664_00645 [Flavihumibacter sp.]
MVGRPQLRQDIVIWHRAVQSQSNAAWRDKTLIRGRSAKRVKRPGSGRHFFQQPQLCNNPNGWNDSLRLDLYRQPAPVPVMPWLPESPTLGA